MVKSALFLTLLGWTAVAEPFSLQIASAVAGQSANVKSASFVFRSQGCAEPEKINVVAKAEGRVNGERRTVPLQLLPAASAGAFAVIRQWPPEGVWIISLAAKCGSSTAGALVVPGERGPNREASKFMTQTATEKEIDAALRALPAK